MAVAEPPILVFTVVTKHYAYARSGFDGGASSILLKRHDGSDRAEMVCLAVAAVRIAVNVDDFSGLCRSGHE
jgi:hypothetical protein